MNDIGFQPDFSDEQKLEASVMLSCRQRPLHFARELLGVDLWDKQEEVLLALRDHRRVAVKAGNGVGKGFTAAVSVLWFLASHTPATVLTTAPTARQVQHVLWREIHRVYHESICKFGGRLMDTRLELSHDQFALGLSTDNVDQFQGFHSPNMLIVVDEAEGVEEPIYEAIDAVMTSGNAKLLLIGNPTSAGGTFRRAFHEDRHLYHNITISTLDSPNVKQQRLVMPGLVTHEWVAERVKVWGEESPMYRARVMGDFSDQASNSLISLLHIEAAIQRHAAEEVQLGESAILPPVLPAILAVDVARFGEDQSVLLVATPSAVLWLEAHHGLDTMELAGRVVEAHRRWSAAHDSGPALSVPGSLGPDSVELATVKKIVVDEVGVGAGVVDRLKELGLPVTGINVGRPARQRAQFANLRAEGYWRLYDLFSQGHISIPNDPELVGQLASLRYSYNSRGQLIIEGKDDARARGIPSPDKADAMMLAFLGHNPTVRLRT